MESLLQAEPWDLVIFDEGHRLSRRQYGQKLDSSERYDLAKNLRSQTKHMLLLSATPHQGMQDKFVALLELLRPERRTELMALNLKPEILHDMVFRNHKADVTDAEGNFIFQGKITKALQVPSSLESVEFDKTLQDYLRIHLALLIEARALFRWAVGNPGQQPKYATQGCCEQSCIN